MWGREVCESPDTAPDDNDAAETCPASNILVLTSSILKLTRGRSESFSRFGWPKGLSGVRDNFFRLLPNEWNESELDITFRERTWSIIGCLLLNDLLPFAVYIQKKERKKLMKIQLPTLPVKFFSPQPYTKISLPTHTLRCVQRLSWV